MEELKDSNLDEVVEIDAGEVEENGLPNDSELDNPIIETETESNLIKDYFSKQGGTPIKEIANIFGQSEDEISKEFSNFKAKKLYSKLDYLLDDTSLTICDFKSQLLLAYKNGFKSVTVYPTFVLLAKDTLKNSGVKVRALISYPYGEDYAKTKNLSIKNAIKNGADELIIAISVSAVKSGNFKNIVKEIKKALKYSKKRSVSVLFELSKLTSPEVEKCAKAIINEAKIYSVVPSFLYSNTTYNVEIIKDLLTAVNGKCYVDVISDIDTATDTVSVLSQGANSLTSKGCVKIVNDLNNKIISNV